MRRPIGSATVVESTRRLAAARDDHTARAGPGAVRLPAGPATGWCSAGATGRRRCTPPAGRPRTSSVLPAGGGPRLPGAACPAARRAFHPGPVRTLVHPAHRASVHPGGCAAGPGAPVPARRCRCGAVPPRPPRRGAGPAGRSRGLARGPRRRAPAAPTGRAYSAPRGPRRRAQPRNAAVIRRVFSSNTPSRSRSWPGKLTSSTSVTPAMSGLLGR